MSAFPLLHPQLSSINSSLPFQLYCFVLNPGYLIFTAYTITALLLVLPPCVLVVFYSLQRRREKCPSTAAATSHSDTFTYHLVTMELVYAFGCILCCSCIYMNISQMLMVWDHLFCLTWYGETVIHVLTCVEHYLAVVHPIIYLSLRKHRGIKIRNITTGCIWLFCLGASGLIDLNLSCILDFCILIFSVVIVSFCSLSVLCVLIRPGPGEKRRDGVRVDQSKQRAFYTTVVILGVLLLRCAWNLVWNVLFVLHMGIDECVWIMCDAWFNLPSSLVSPLLFLQKAKKCACCKSNNK